MVRNVGFPKRLAFGLSPLAILFAAEVSAVTAQPYYDETWLKINQYSAVEGYESHGSYGWHLGLGVLHLPHPLPNPETLEDGAENLPITPGIPREIPRLFLTKGSSLPLDFGLSFARLPENSGLQLGGHVQWTFFEGFQKPALALRFSRIETSGLKGLQNLQTDSVLLGISYGFWRYCNLGLGIGRQWSQLRAQSVDDDNEFGLLGRSAVELNQIASLWTLNFQLNLFSPFIKIGAERIYTSPTESISLIKVSYLL